MRKYSYGSRLDEIARNILFGMEIIDKRIDSRPKNIKKELDEEEAKQAMIEQDRFFSDEATKKKLERLKFLIADETNQKKLKHIWEGKLTPTSSNSFEKMNMRVNYDPYSEL